jgi:hypothetical protein
LPTLFSGQAWLHPSRTCGDELGGIRNGNEEYLVTKLVDQGQHKGYGKDMPKSFNGVCILNIGKIAHIAVKVDEFAS